MTNIPALATMADLQQQIRNLKDANNLYKHANNLYRETVLDLNQRLETEKAKTRRIRAAVCEIWQNIAKEEAIRPGTATERAVGAILNMIDLIE